MSIESPSSFPLQVGITPSVLTATPVRGASCVFLMQVGNGETRHGFRHVVAESTAHVCMEKREGVASPKRTRPLMLTLTNRVR